MQQNHYQIMGVPQTASLDDIKKAYRQLARTQHPDKAKTDDERRKLEDAFAAITTAYNVLKDEDQRKAYDASLAKAHAAPGAVAAPAASSPPAAAPATGNKAATQSPLGLDVARGKRDVAMRAYAQGVKLMQLNDYVRAADFFRAAVQSQPDEAQFHDRLATCLLKSKRNFTEAVASAEKAAELDPYKSEYKIHLAELFEAIGNHDRALNAYRDILKWDPENFVAQSKLSEAAANSTVLGKFKRWYGKLVGRLPGNE